MSADKQASHSELPWENGRQFPVVFNADGREILSCHDHLREREAEANAAFIVRAVNAFYPLVDALKDARDTLSAMAFVAFDIGLEGTKEWDAIAGGVNLHARIDELNAALKLTEASDG